MDFPPVEESRSYAMSIQHRLTRVVAALISAGLFFMTLAPAGADDYTSTSLTAVQILAKSDAAYGKLEPGDYVSVYRTQGGGMDTVETTRTSGDDDITTWQSGEYTTAGGWFKGQSWTQDENGVVLLRSNFRSRVDPNVIALRRPENPANRVTVLGVTTSKPAAYVIEVNPPGGSDEFRYYDATTFLLDRVVWFAKDRYKHTTEYAGYRKIFGEMVAARETYGDGRPQNDRISELVSYSRAPAGSPPVTMPESRPLFSLPGNKPLVLPARFESDGIVIRATINGRGLDFLLDSGSDSLMIDPGIAHDLGLPSYGIDRQTMGGDVDISRTRIPSMSIGPLQLRDVVFEITPLSMQTDDARVVGILGCDFLASAIVGIDFKRQTVTLYPRTSFDAQSLGARAYPIEIDDGVPRIQAFVGGISGSFLVDTGAFMMFFYPQYLKRIKSTRESDRIVSTEAIGGDVDTHVYDFDDFIFGGIKFGHGSALVPITSTFDLLDYDGILGRDVLQDYQLYFDYANRTLFMRNNL
jgi:hypothetical protein